MILNVGRIPQAFAVLQGKSGQTTKEEEGMDSLQTKGAP